MGVELSLCLGRAGASSLPLLRVVPVEGLKPMDPEITIIISQVGKVGLPPLFGQQKRLVLAINLELIVTVIFDHDLNTAR